MDYTRSSPPERVIRWTCTGLILLAAQGAVLLVLAACGGGSPQDEVPPLALEEVARYGWRGPVAGNATRLPSDAGLLAQVVAMVETADSVLYALDRDWARIVAFGPDGGVVRVIPLDAGEGPGEIRLPIDLQLTPDGELAVLDYQLSRIVVMDSVGTLQRTTRLDRTGLLSFVATRDGFAAGRALTPGRSGSALFFFDHEGQVVDVAPDISAEDVPFGSAGSITMGRDGEVLHASVRPGIWRRFHDSTFDEQGVPLVAQLEPPSVRLNAAGQPSVDSPQAFTTGIGALRDGTVLISHLWRPVLPGRDGEFDSRDMRIVLTAMTEAGQIIGQVELPWGTGGSWFVSPVSDHLFVFSEEPYPTIIRYRIRL